MDYSTMTPGMILHSNFHIFLDINKYDVIGVTTVDHTS